MTASLTPNPSAETTRSAAIGSSEYFRSRKVHLDIGWRDIIGPLGFLLSLSLTGLMVYPAFLFSCLYMINRLKTCREEFVLILTILAADRGLLQLDVFPIRIRDILLVVSVLSLFIIRQNRLTKKVTWTWLAYTVFVFIIAMLSDEVMPIQLLTIRQYLSLILFTIPLWVFANRVFDLHEFFRKVLIYFILISAFYFLDGFILNGWILLPGTSNNGIASSIQSLVWLPFSDYFPRKYPQGYYIALIAAYPLARYYRFRWWQWGIIILGFAATRTISFISGFFITYVIFQGTFKTFVKYFLLSVVSVFALYLVDEATGGNMRISSTVNQFATVMIAEDDEDLAEFGSSRMAQVIPKYEALRDQKCLLQGFGFIHPTKTTNPKYVIENKLYTDIEQSEEVAAITEVTQFNTVINTGIIGLFVQAGVYIAIFLIIGGRKYGSFYLSVIIGASIMGLGGFAGLNTPDGLAWMALTLAIGLLMQRPRQKNDASEGYF